MRMDGVGNVLGRQSQPYGKRAFSDKVAGMGSHDVHPQDSATVGMTDHLDHASRLAHGYRTTAGGEGKFAHSVRNPTIAGFLLGDADTGYLGLGKDTIRDGAIICLARMPKGIIDSYLSFVRGNMSQHVLAQNIPDGINIFDVCLKVFIHLDSPPVRLYTEL